MAKPVRPARARTLRRKTALKRAASLSRPRAACLQIPALPSPQRSRTDDPFVFVAYARDDAPVGAALVETLRARRVPVMWDRNLLGGERFRSRISELIERAGAVLVIWSPASVGSDFVIDEAEAGKTLGKLVTCRTADVRDADIPFGFRGLHCANVDDLDGLVESLAMLEVGPQTA
jgi:hypothetical protein